MARRRGVTLLGGEGKGGGSILALRTQWATGKTFCHLLLPSAEVWNLNMFCMVQWRCHR